MQYRLVHMPDFCLSETLNDMMCVHGLTIEDLSEKLHVNRYETERIINGDDEMSYELAVKLSGIFPVHVSFWGYFQIREDV